MSHTVGSKLCSTVYLTHASEYLKWVIPPQKKTQKWKWTSFEEDPKLNCLQIGGLFQNV